MSKKRSELKHKRKIHDEQNMLDDTSLSKHLQIILFYVIKSTHNFKIFLFFF